MIRSDKMGFVGNIVPTGIKKKQQEVLEKVIELDRPTIDQVLDTSGLLLGFPSYASQCNGEVREVLRLAVKERTALDSREFIEAVKRLHYRGKKNDWEQIVSYMKRYLPPKYHCIFEDAYLLRRTKAPLCPKGCKESNLIRGGGGYCKPKVFCSVCGQVHSVGSGDYKPLGRQVVLSVLEQIKKGKHVETLSVYNN